MIIGPNLAEILNFSTVKHGGAHGGRRPSTGSLSSGICLVFVKNPLFQGHRGGDQGGADGGALKWGGGWGGDFRHTWGGDGGGVRRTCGAILAKKNTIF